MIGASQIETMNVQELTLKLRALGMKVSEAVISDGIEQGVYSRFAECIHTKDGGRRFYVYTRLLNEWIAERATPVERT